MAMIHVSRSGATLGVFEEEKVRQGLRTGEFIGTDLGWMEGMPSWRPLSELENFRAAPPSPPPAAAAPSPAPQPVVAAAATAATATGRTGLPWENRTSDNFFNAMIDTITMVLTKPEQAFAVMKREGGLTDPVLYILIIGTICGVIARGYSSLLHAFGMFRGTSRWDMMLGAGVGWGFIFVLPVIIVVFTFIGSAVVHVCLMIVGGAKQPFETTLRVLCFGGGSAHVLQLIPICGGLFAGIASLILNCIGLARAHEIDTGRAVIAVLLPCVVCCGGWLLFVFAVFGAAASGHWH